MLISPRLSAHLRTAAPARAASETVLFQSEHKLTQNTDGSWLLHLPNAKVPMPQKPRWLKTQEQLNDILKGSTDPAGLRAAHDQLEETAQRSYDSTSMNFDRQRLTQAAAALEDGFRPALREMFELKLEAETRSTHQVGGSMAGARCSQMRIFTEILAVL